MREHVLHVTANDCEWSYFAAGGKGGQKQNKTATACRVRHAPSGAVGESRTYRTQLQNRRAAWRRMAESAVFQRWARLQAAEQQSIESIVADWMRPENLRIETFDG